MTPADPGGCAEILLHAGAEPMAGYRLVRRLGRGGFGEVWEATAPGGLRVALKFVRRLDPPGESELRALELVKEIRHPNLLALFGAWQAGGYLIVGMELADRTLLDRLREAQAAGAAGIPREELLDAMEEAARGIDHLNACKHMLSDRGPAGIQHRDIKPRNILLLGGGVKVADYGLARLLERDATGHTGSMTPAYSPPEFFGGRTSDRSDQYSLAVTFCELRGGRLPFLGDTAAIMAGHLHGAPDLGMIPLAERPAIDRALAKVPADRWPTCRDLVRALRAARPDEGWLEAPVPPAAPSAWPATRPIHGAPGPAASTERPPAAFAPVPADRRRARKVRVLVAVALLTATGLALLSARPIPGAARGPDSPRGPAVSADAEPTDTPDLPPPPAPAGGPDRVAGAPALHEVAEGAHRKVIAGADSAGGEGEAKGAPTAPIEPPAGTPADLREAEAHLRRGDRLFAEGEYRKAVAEYDEFIRFKADDAGAFINRGNAYKKMGAFREAIASYGRAIALSPGEAVPYFNRGTAYTADNQLDRAAEDFGRAIELRPTFADAYHNRGVVFDKRGDRDRARADLETAARLESAAKPAP